MAHAFIGLGSNLDDRLALLRAAVAALAALPDSAVVATSPVYETRPVGPIADQPSFLNAVTEVETRLTPRALLDRLLAIETGLGRVREASQGPRRIDLDLLLFDRRIIDEPGLQVPHPRLAERAFVVVPLCDLRPTIVHPASGIALITRCEALSRQGIARFASAAALG